MADYCLPPKYASAFVNALKSGTITPEKMLGMTSAERHALFEKIVGPENATNVNALLESKLLLKDQQRGMITWAKQVGGISEAQRADLVSKIMKLDRVLQPADEDSFLADLAEKRLGVGVTADEAQRIFDLAQKVQAAKQARAGGWTPENGRAYGLAYQDLIETIESMKPKPTGLLHVAADVLNVPRSLLTLGHFSAPFVQAWGVISTPQWYRAFPKMFQYFVDEQNYRNMMADIIGHPLYETAKKAGLRLTDLGDKLSMREEAIQSTLVEKANELLSTATGIPNVARASSRGFTGYLNYVRWQTFLNLHKAAEMAGEDVALGAQSLKDIANVVNNFTGRGYLGRYDTSDAAALANSVFFAPRKLAGTIQMFNPWNMLNPNISRTARMAHMRLLGGSLLWTATALGAARAMGFSIDLDPRSADFGKIGIGKTHLEITGGNAIYVRLLGRMVANQEITASGKLVNLGENFMAPTRADLLGRFLRGKLAPTAALVADALYGKDPVGRPFSLTQEMQDKLIPITIGSWIDFAENDPNNYAAILPSLLAAFGVGLEPPLPGRSGLNAWGEPGTGDPNDPVESAVTKLGIDPALADHNIRGVKLTDQQYEFYQRTSGRAMKAALGPIVQAPWFRSLAPGLQEKLIKETMANQREIARQRTMMQFPALIPQAAAAKQKALMQGSPAVIKRREALQ